MKTVPVDPAAGPLRFICTKCGRWVDQAQEIVYADHDGVPFVDYYCVQCAVIHVVKES